MVVSIGNDSEYFLSPFFEVFFFFWALVYQKSREIFVFIGTVGNNNMLHFHIRLPTDIQVQNLNQWESWVCDHEVSNQALLASNSTHTSHWLYVWASVCVQATHTWSQCCLTLCNITCWSSRPWSDFQTNKRTHYVPGPVLHTWHRALSLVSKQPWEVHFIISSILQNVKLMKCRSLNMKCP